MSPMTFFSQYGLIIIVAVVVVIVIVAVVSANRGSRQRALSQPQSPAATRAPISSWTPSAASSRTNTLAILSLVFAFFISLLAVIFGHVAISQISRTGEGGRGMATAGLILGYFGLLAGAVMIVVGMTFFGTHNY